MSRHLYLTSLWLWIKSALLAFALMAVFSLPAKATSTGIQPFQAGMNIILRNSDFSDLSELDWKVDALLQRLTSININSLSLTWLIYTDGVRSNDLFVGDDTPSLEAITLFVSKAKAAGFTVMLRPLIDEQAITASGKDEWRGTIRPRNVEAWFESYGNLLVSYASLAKSLEADSIVIATELTSMERYPDNWRKLIGKIKEVYAGQLTYSSNQEVSLKIPWDALDFVSVDAFFRLSTPRNNASTEDMIVALERKVKAIAAAAIKIGLPLVFTEIGSTSQKNAHKKTWVWDHKTKVDLEDQRRFYFAACAVSKSRVSGMYWWAVSANIWQIPHPETDAGFSPFGKPAEAEIKRCFEE